MYDIVRIVKVQLIDLFPGYELVNLDDALALDGDCVKLFRIKLKVLALAELVALYDVVGLDLIARFSIHFSILDAVSSLLVDLMEADFFPLG
jgi:hypothetical protein